MASMSTGKLVRSIVVASILMAPKVVFAYVDPNSAGVLYQLLFPLIVGVSLAWRWIARTFRAFQSWLRNLFG